MSTEQEQKLTDYLEGLKELSASVFPLGAVIYSNDINLTSFLNEKTSVLGTDEHPERVLKNLADFIQKGTLLSLVVDEDLSPLISEQLRNLAHGRMVLRSLGSDELESVTPHTNAGVILIVRDDIFDHASWRDIPASVCRL